MMLDRQESGLTVWAQERTPGWSRCGSSRHDRENSCPHAVRWPEPSDSTLPWTLSHTGADCCPPSLPEEKQCFKTMENNTDITNKLNTLPFKSMEYGCIKLIKSDSKDKHRRISEGSCDIEDWSNDTENSSFASQE